MISCTTPVYETAMTVLAKRTALLSPLASFPSAVLRTARVLQTAEPETLRNGVLPSFLNYPLLSIGGYGTVLWILGRYLLYLLSVVSWF